MNLILTVTGKRMVVWVQSGSECQLLTGRGPVDAQRERSGAWLASLEKIQVPKASMVSTRPLLHHRRVKEP